MCVCVCSGAAAAFGGLGDAAVPCPSVSRPAQSWQRRFGQPREVTVIQGAPMLVAQCLPCLVRRWVGSLYTQIMHVVVVVVTWRLGGTRRRREELGEEEKKSRRHQRPSCRDRAERLGLKECHQRGGQGCILAERLMHEVKCTLRRRP